MIFPKIEKQLSLDMDLDPEGNPVTLRVQNVRPAPAIHPIWTGGKAAENVYKAGRCPETATFYHAVPLTCGAH